MRLRRFGQMTRAVFTVWMVTLASVASAQQSLDRAREFYDSAAYEEALAVLEPLNASPEAPTEVAAYTVFCLVALGRSEEATEVVESIVRRDPLFRPSETQASPRVRTFFDGIRRPLLPKYARVLYAKAKSAFDRKDMPAAASEFDRVLDLLDEIGSRSDDEGLSDLRTLAQSFQELTRLALAAPPAPALAASVPAQTALGRHGAPIAQEPALIDGLSGAPAAAATAPPTVREPRVYSPSDIGVTKPVAITRSLPSWQPRNPVEAKQNFRGTAEIEVDEQGNVSSVVLRKPIHPTFDPVLTEAMRSWKFRPALKDGVAVKYRYWADITLGASGR